MTESDWLLTVLSIYLHDLGMLVTQEEFEQRNSNDSFTSWLRSLEDTREGREFAARTAEMEESERQVFFFQEFVRLGHASRIREWITGRHSRTWGQQVRPAADLVASLLRSLPTRFREHLASVCESHHKDNLENIELYPLCAPCGRHAREVVNVQYSAVLLRTTDLLHVTQDRTPSEQYQLIRLSDPIGIREWTKRSGTFAVRPKGRSVDESNPDSAVILVIRTLQRNDRFSRYKNTFRTQIHRSVNVSDGSTRAARVWTAPTIRFHGMPFEATFASKECHLSH